MEKNIKDIYSRVKININKVVAEDFENNCRNIMRELLHELHDAKKIEVEGFPFPELDKSVYKGGVDGDCNIRTIQDSRLLKHFMLGNSLWELSIRKDVGTKINQDSKNRSAKLKRVSKDPADYNFVFISSQEISEKEYSRYIKKCKKHGWRNVVIIDLNIFFHLLKWLSSSLYRDFLSICKLHIDDI